MQAEPRSRERSLGSPLSWWIALIAVVGHLPALAGFFAESDWWHLALAAGETATPLGHHDPVMRWLFWKLLWPVLGLAAPSYHAVLLLAWSACSVLTIRLAERLGLDRPLAHLAGLLVAASPVAVGPVFWLEDGGAVLAAALALGGCEAAFARHRVARFVAVVLSVLATLSHPVGLVTPILLSALAVWAPPQPRPFPLLAAAFSASGAAWALVLHSQSGVSWAALPARTWTVLGAWLLSPWDYSPASTSWLPQVGIAAWALWLIVAIVWPATRRFAATRVGLVAGFASVFITSAMTPDPGPAVLTLAAVAWCWTLVVVVRELTGWPTTNPAPPAALWITIGVMLIGWSWASTRNQLWSRDSFGRLTNARARSVSICSATNRVIQSMPLAPEDVTLAVLQAVPDFEAFPMDTLQADQGIVASPTYRALAGPLGLQILTPESVTVRWLPHLDGLRRDALVLMDAGGTALHPLGRVENARFYSALIAIQAEQFVRARHDLWTVTGLSGTKAVFAYRPELLQLDPARFDRAALGFVQYLEDDQDGPQRDRVRLLFEQLYSTVRERPLSELLAD